MESVSVGCLLVTRLPVKAALLARPELAGRPFVVYGRDGRVLGASPEAAGARVGAPLSEALSTDGGLEPVAVDDAAVAALRRSVCEALCGCVPGVEPAGDGVFYLDVSGMARLAGSMDALAGGVLASCGAALRPRLGLAVGKFPAWVASLEAPPRGWRAVPADAAAWLSGKPVSLLPVNEAALRRLARFGVRRLGDLSRIPLVALSDFLGPDAGWIAGLARGIDPAPVVAAKLPEVLERRVEFPFPVDSAAGLESGLRGLCGGLWDGGPLASGRRVGEAALAGGLADGGSWRFSRTLRFPAGSAEALFRYLSSVVRWPEGAFLDLTLAVSGLSAEAGVQGSLWDGSRRRAALPAGVWRPALLDDGAGLLPERSWGLGPGLRPLALPRPVMVEGCGAPRRVCLGRWRRVEAVVERWEVELDWWGPAPVRRAYWSVALEGGRTATLFRDFVDGLWYRQGG